MIDFKVELKRFDKSLDVTEIEDSLASSDITDMNDVMFKMIEEAKENNQWKDIK